ncbi:MAG: outer membrane protein transport protein [Candidatus Eisenbacteria bacterium]|jgi:long-chain fatty acid transport protein|nr:outer membrane protein transport protein [Candidatus Eisenbacteria bacterium]
MHQRVVGVTLMLMLGIGAAWGSGFEIPEVGSRAMSVAVAFTGIADDPSAVWFNPAGITFLKGSQSAVGFTAIVVPGTKFTGRNAGSPSAPDTVEAKDDIFTPVHFYLVSDLGMEKLRLGLGINSPFGLAKRWPAGSSFASDVITMGLSPVFVNPSLAYQVMPCLSAAAGFTFVRSSVTLMKAPYNYSIDRDGNLLTSEGGDRMFALDMDGSGTGTGFNGALMGRFMEGKLGIGVTYRSKIKVELEGDASFGDISQGYLPIDVTGDGVPDPVPVSQALFGVAGLRNAKDAGSTELTFPAMLKFGASYKVMPCLTLTADFDMTMWSSYDTLSVVFDKYVALNKPQAKNWEDTNAIRMGVMYRMKEWLELGAGFLIDKNPIPDETIGAELPDTDRTGITLGAAIGRGPLSLNVGFLHLMMKDRDTDNLVLPSAASGGAASYQTGTFESSAQLFGITLSHAF